MIRSFDTETGGLDWFEADQGPFIVTWSDENGLDQVARVDDSQAMDRFKHDLASSDLLVAHNLSFDVHQLREHCGFDILELGIPLVDTDILARVVCPERGAPGADGGRAGYKLKDLATTYVDPKAKDSEEEMKRLAKSAGIKLKEKGGYLYTWRAFPEAVETYAMEDTRLTLGLYKALIGKVDSAPRIWQLERAAVQDVIRAEARGVALDQSKVAPLKAEYERRLAESYDKLLAAGFGDAIGDPFDSQDKDDHAELRDVLLGLGIPLYRKVKSCPHRGEPCECNLATNRFALKEFIGDYPVIQDLFDLRTSAKFLATYVNPMVDRDVVHTSYRQIGAWTGRMSATRPNMQNLPVRGEAAAGLREMFVPRPGYCFVVSDFDAIEARLLAYYLGPRGERYRQMIEEDFDVHAWMASLIWGGQPDDYAKGGPNDKLRTLAKNVLFAICYGAGIPRVMDMLADAGMKSSRETARSLISTIKSGIPGFWKLSDRIRAKVANDGYVTTLMGRKQTVRKEKAYVGLNALIQGSAADIFKQAVVNVAEATAHLDATPLLFVHDEIGTEVPVEHAEECRRLQDLAMEAACDTIRPGLKVSSTICLNNYAEGK